MKIPDTSVTVFHTRFGGSLSIEQELEDLTDHFPTWFRPIWKFVLPFLKRWIRRAKIARTMASVDRQAAEIKQAWTVEERQQVVQAAVEKARLLLKRTDGRSSEIALRPKVGTGPWILGFRD